MLHCFACEEDVANPPSGGDEAADREPRCSHCGSAFVVFVGSNFDDDDDGEDSLDDLILQMERLEEVTDEETAAGTRGPVSSSAPWRVTAGRRRDRPRTPSSGFRSRGMVVTERAALVFSWLETRKSGAAGGDSFLSTLPLEVLREVTEHLRFGRFDYAQMFRGSRVRIGAEGNSPVQFRDPMYCAVTQQGLLVVGDSDNRRVSVVDPDQRHSPWVFHPPAGSHTSGVGVFPDGRIAVAELTGPRVYVVRTGRDEIECSTGPKALIRSEVRKMGCLWGLSVDPDTNTVFCADSDRYCIDRFQLKDDTFEALPSFQSPRQDGKFTRCPAVDPVGRQLYVAHTDAIDVFNLDTDPADNPFQGTFLTCGDEKVDIVSDPNGIVVDTDQNLVVSMGGFGGCVRVVDPQGQLIAQAGGFNYPCGVALDHERGRLFVCERSEHCVYMFEM
jgi:DNA-binding beta-propeller fold protein YncE